MEIEKVNCQGAEIAVAWGEEKVITGVQPALDLLMTVKYQTGADRVAIDKRLFCEDFFILSTGLAGEILQKFVNYHMKAAVFGDFSRYTSKPLKDFMYESNNGKDIFFTASREEAVEKLAQAG